jgi:hypothetical protein
MSQPWWKKILEALGRPRLPVSDRTFIRVTTGLPNGDDAQGGMEWFDLSTTEALFTAWSPVAGSPWEAFHCAPLFAAVDRIPREMRGPTDPELAEAMEAPLEPLQQWLFAHPATLEPGTWVIVDLPGEQSVALAVDLLRGGGQTICTFDHWPHEAGLLKPEKILGQLLRHATSAAALRERLTVQSPPLWICDRGRLGSAPGLPREFDNRYFLDDSILPGPAILRAASIRRVLYIAETHGQPPVPDVAAYFSYLQKEAGMEIVGLGRDNPEAGFYAPPPPSNSFFNKSSFQRAAAGGFGTLIPTESSSSG